MCKIINPPDESLSKIFSDVVKGKNYYQYQVYLAKNEDLEALALEEAKSHAAYVDSSHTDLIAQKFVDTENKTNETVSQLNKLAELSAITDVKFWINNRLDGVDNYMNKNIKSLVFGK